MRYSIITTAIRKRIPVQQTCSARQAVSRSVPAAELRNHLTSRTRGPRAAPSSKIEYFSK